MLDILSEARKVSDMLMESVEGHLGLDGVNNDAHARMLDEADSATFENVMQALHRAFAEAMTITTHNMVRNAKHEASMKWQATKLMKEGE